ncbi:MAG: hypothetical protein LBU48_03755 [Coriobacteriales bacterium]|jgi:hypothetical protein|nr:hypothetical protein [Coriobacteriales bacterium]
MKKALLLLFAGALAFALVGCGGSEPPEPTPEGPDAELPLTTPDPDPEPEPDPVKTPKPSADATFDAATALGLDSTSKDNPAKLNQWIATMKYCSASKQDELVYVRVTELIRDQTRVQAAIDAYNKTPYSRPIEPLKEDDLEYLILTYQVYFPEDYPVDPELGSTNTAVTFALANYEGGGFENANGSVYIGLGVPVQDISTRIEYPDSIKPGEVWADGQNVFVMVKGTTDFLVQTYYFTDAGQQDIWFKE